MAGTPSKRPTLHLLLSWTLFVALLLPGRVHARGAGADRAEALGSDLLGGGAGVITDEPGEPVPDEPPVASSGALVVPSDPGAAGEGGEVIREFEDIAARPATVPGAAISAAAPSDEEPGVIRLAYAGAEGDGGGRSIWDRMTRGVTEEIPDTLNGHPWSRAHIGSRAQPEGWFAGTPEVTFTIDGKPVTVSIPPVSGGQTVHFYRYGRAGRYYVEAESGEQRWRLVYHSNWLVPALAHGWDWDEQ